MVVTVVTRAIRAGTDAHRDYQTRNDCGLVRALRIPDRSLWYETVYDLVTLAEKGVEKLQAQKEQKQRRRASVSTPEERRYLQRVAIGYRDAERESGQREGTASRRRSMPPPPSPPPSSISSSSQSSPASSVSNVSSARSSPASSVPSTPNMPLPPSRRGSTPATRRPQPPAQPQLAQPQPPRPRPVPVPTRSDIVPPPPPHLSHLPRPASSSASPLSRPLSLSLPRCRRRNRSASSPPQPTQTQQAQLPPPPTYEDQRGLFMPTLQDLDAGLIVSLTADNVIFEVDDPPPPYPGPPMTVVAPNQGASGSVGSGQRRSSRRRTFGAFGMLSTPLAEETEDENEARRGSC